MKIPNVMTIGFVSPKIAIVFADAVRARGHRATILKDKRSVRTDAPPAVRIRLAADAVARLRAAGRLENEDDDLLGFKDGWYHLDSVGTAKLLAELLEEDGYEATRQSVRIRTNASRRVVEHHHDLAFKYGDTMDRARSRGGFAAAPRARHEMELGTYTRGAVERIGRGEAANRWARDRARSRRRSSKPKKRSVKLPMKWAQGGFPGTAAKAAYMEIWTDPTISTPYEIHAFTRAGRRLGWLFDADVDRLKTRARRRWGSAKIVWKGRK